MFSTKTAKTGASLPNCGTLLATQALRMASDRRMACEEIGVDLCRVPPQSAVLIVRIPALVLHESTLKIINEMWQDRPCHDFGRPQHCFGDLADVSLHLGV